MARVRYTRQAREDLFELWAFVAARNPAAADRVVDRIGSRCRLLCDHPRIGRARPEIGAGARMLVIDRWLALYRLTEDGVQIVRIVAGARDLSAVAWPQE